MKKSFLTIFLFITGIQLNAQDIEIYDNLTFGEVGDVDISGTTVDILTDLSDTNAVITADFYVKIVTDTVMDLRLERYRMVNVEGAEDFMRWERNVVEGIGLYPTSVVSATDNFITHVFEDVDSTDLIDFADFYFHRSSIGCSRYRFYLLNEFDDYVDSVDVRYCSLLSIEESSSLLNGIIIYPNPIMDVVNLTLPDNYSGNHKCVIHTIKGEEVLVIDQVVANQNPINLSAFPAGNYVLFLQEKETNKVVYESQLIKQ